MITWQTNKTSYKFDYCDIEEFIARVVEHLNVDYQSHCLDSRDVIIEFRSDMDWRVLGRTIPTHVFGNIGTTACNNEIVVQINEDYSSEAMLETIAHELVHVYQFNSNRLGLVDLSDNPLMKLIGMGPFEVMWDNVSWGIMGQLPYLSCPWEQEAIEMSSKLMKTDLFIDLAGKYNHLPKHPTEKQGSISFGAKYNEMS